MYVAQAGTIQSAGCVRLDINLLKPSRLEFQDQDIAPDVALPLGHRLCSSPDWLEYVYRTSHPVLRWLPTKLAEWIGENLQDALGFPDKGDVRAGPGCGWTAAELNHILQAARCGWYLDNVRTVSWRNACQMLPVQDAKAALSWRDTAMYLYISLIFTMLFWF